MLELQDKVYESALKMFVDEPYGIQVYRNLYPFTLMELNEMMLSAVKLCWRLQKHFISFGYCQGLSSYGQESCKYTA